MSNQFYYKLASLLTDYFKNTGLKAGERFYLQMDKQSDVTGLIQELENDNQAVPFTYSHKLGDEYKTFSLPFDSVNLVVACTSDFVKPDFLVTLRNLVGEQIDGKWKNTALLSIVSEQLDSIQGGSSDLQKQGMPLHASSLYENLKNGIEEKEMDKVDKIILLDDLDNIMNEQAYQQVTFFDFEDIFSTLQKGKIDDDEYHKFSLFKDPDLSTFKGKEQEKRLKENRELFEYVKKVHDFGLGQDELEKKFSSAGAKELITEEWKDTLFHKVHKYNQDYLNNNKKKKVELNQIDIIDHLVYWDKPQKETTAGQRKRFIIIFNPEGKEEVELQISFNLSANVKSLLSEHMKIPSPFTKLLKAEVKKTKIQVKIKTEATNPTFVRLAYKHDNKASLGAEFVIAVLPINPIYLDSYKAKYSIDPAVGLIELQYEEDTLSFGDRLGNKQVEIQQEDQLVTVTEDEKLTITPLPEAFNDNDELKINIKFDKAVIPFLLKNELPESFPISGQRISRLIRETGNDIQWNDNNRLILGNREFYFHPEYKEFFEWEKKWLEKGYKTAKYDSGQILGRDLKISEDLREAYSRFITYFNIRGSIPSLCVLTDDLKERSLDYINEYQKEIKSFKDGTPAGSKGMDLLKLGMIHGTDMIYMTPFHPLMVAFKLKTYELLQSENVDNSILNRLTSESLIPFLYDESEMLFKPDHQQAALEWMIFKPVSKVSVSDANQYLAKVVSDKITQFKEHFSYLFIQKSQAPMYINVINIANDHEVIRGILKWILKEIENNGGESLVPVEVTLYKERNTESSFDLYAQTEKVEQFENLFDLNLKSKDLDAEDTLRIIREKLFFYKQGLEAELRYAHISFYKMHAQEHHAVQPIEEMASGIAIEGLYSSVPSMKDEETYKTGFGTKGYRIKEENILTSTAYYVNELAANMRNAGNDSYRKGEAILSRTTTADEKTLERIFESSYWVTFVDPSVDLEFFNNYNRNLVVIHYSDQYSSSSRFDAITVTDKSQQYFAVIKEFLEQKNVDGNDENVHNTIKAFNTFNGEWLLRIIGSKGHYDREKLSIISAIKYSVSYFDHPNILWVPISLEEILRVAGAVSLNKSDGVFTTKNLQVKGSKSDDLLLIGLEKSDKELRLHFYPVEVKIGYNKSDVLDKARSQVINTKKVFTDALTGEMGEKFTGKFYRNFFAQLFISNAKKLEQSDFWMSKNYLLSDEIIEQLLNDEYTVANNLTKFIGEGAILSFQKDSFHRSAHLEDDVLLLNLTEKDGYEGLVVPIEDMRLWIQEKSSDFIKEDMLSYQYKSDDQDKVRSSMETSQAIETGEEKEKYQETNSIIELPINHLADTEEGKQSLDKSKDDPNQGLIDNRENQSKESINLKEIREPEPLSPQETYPLLEDIRIKIGRAENSNREIFWEYGNKGLANRHLLISGKSGQGKTYFMQCLLLEKSKLGIPSIVIDYTEGFLPNQLEPEFVEFLGDKLKQKIVYSEKLPINPFQRNVRDIGGIQLPESNTDVAERIKSVFSAVYKSLGIQQQNAIYEAVLKGLERYDTKLSLSHLKELLEEEGTNYAKTALSQIRPLTDRDPFSVEDVINWSDIIESDGEVYIIQLTAFPRDVQLIITEFILWDLWNHSVRFGNKNKPMPVIMDEAQNLDHTEKSPSARILTEGRKFGWSAWYATQFLKSQLETDELARLQNSAQKVYFAPPEQELTNIAGSLSKDAQDKRFWENKLSSLKKGQCIVHGPVKQDRDLSNPTATIVDIIPLSERI
ncbi:DNA phosphorothioation-dependent restriction protein DptH [Peribacillus frigoritolerans]|uniref:DNA phosphorothioation-dependent restriction protein DptH n=1 Tax=Peribacillus frigoritolerans TaxID=450367 RepID=UPI003513E205